ncbi:hypothetical protein CCP4SC76_5620002 [Gammaproteobacteria bacterium]
MSKMFDGRLVASGRQYPRGCHRPSRRTGGSDPVRPSGTIPRTTSGKIQRGLTRERYLAGTLTQTTTELLP